MITGALDESKNEKSTDSRQGAVLFHVPSGSQGFWVYPLKYFKNSESVDSISEFLSSRTSL